MSSYLDDERDLARETQLAKHVDGMRFGHPLYAFDRIGSTMDVAHELAAGGAAEGTLVWASRQDEGRGRLGRTWESPQGGIYFSLVLRPSRSLAEVPQLSLVAGLATVEAIHMLTLLFPSIRWPNDILIEGRKVAGILVEVKAGAVVLGIGINVTTSEGDLPEAATSLAIVGVKAPDVYRLTGAVCRSMQTWYDTWTMQGFEPIREALRAWMGLFGQPVHISAGSSQLEGTASDLDEAGRLVVRLDSGMLRAFDVGEVTLLR